MQILFTLVKIETIRALFTYLIALFVVVAGFYVIVTRGGTPEFTDTIAIIAGFVGSALTFVFGAEVQARTARQSAAATLAAGKEANGSHAAAPAGSPAADAPKDLM